MSQLTFRRLVLTAAGSAGILLIEWLTGLIGSVLTVYLCALLLVVGGLGAIALDPDRPAGPARDNLEGMWLSLTSLMGLLLILEIGMRMFFIRSEDFSVTLANQAWFGRYWQPVDSEGYRDYAWTAESLEGKRIVVVLSDSFGAGFGIRDYEDTFARQAAHHLGSDYAVINRSLIGRGTEDHIATLASMSLSPDVVVLGYVPNDIQGRTAELGLLPEQPTRPPAWLQAPIEQSHLINFVYYQLYRLTITPANDYIAYLRQVVDDETIWAAHEADLRRLAALTRAQEAQLIVVIFPLLGRPEDTRFLTGRVAEVFETEGAQVLDITDWAAGQAPGSLIVSAVDQHPNEFVHAYVGEQIAELIRRANE